MSKAVVGLVVLAVVIVAVFFLAMRRQQTHSYKPGGIYSVRYEKGFRVVKVLAVESGVVHIRLYKNTYDQRPSKIDLGTLTLGTIHDRDGFGIGHLPLYTKDFAAWQPVFTQESTLSKDDLDGYEYWKESNGGVWKTSE